MSAAKSPWARIAEQLYLKDGHVLGEEVEAAYMDLFGNEAKLP